MKTPKKRKPVEGKKKPQPRKTASEKKAATVAEALSKSQEARQQRWEAKVKNGQEALMNALAKSLVLLRFRGYCPCGLMLTDRDKVPKSNNYRCPQCGRTGALAPAPAP